MRGTKKPILNKDMDNNKPQKTKETNKTEPTKSPQIISDKDYCEVKIFGDVYKLVSNESNFGKLQEIAGEVDKQMRLISTKYPEFPKYKIAILVALNITDSLFRKEDDALKQEASSKNEQKKKNSKEKTFSESDFDRLLSQQKEEKFIMRIEKLINDIDEVL